MAEDLYDVARKVTDQVCGEGTYAELNKNHPDPGVQAAIARALDEPHGLFCLKCGGRMMPDGDWGHPLVHVSTGTADCEL